MDKYHKIHTIFKRPHEGNGKFVIEGDWTNNIFEYLADNKWLADEKLDGTNTRLIWDSTKPGIVEINGKTDRAQFNPQVLDDITKQVDASGIRKYFQERIPGGPDDDDHMVVCLYGETVGPKVQKGGGNYVMDGGPHEFVICDMKVTNMTKSSSFWMSNFFVREAANDIGFPTAPTFGEMNLHQAVSWVKAHSMTSKYGPKAGLFLAEGLVLRTKVDLLGQHGNRVITKLKLKDFPKPD